MFFKAATLYLCLTTYVQATFPPIRGGPAAPVIGGTSIADGDYTSIASPMGRSINTLAPVNLRTAGQFAILAESGISTVPSSSITGDIGNSPLAGTAITGFSLTLDSSGTFATAPQVVGKIFAANYKVPTPSNLITAIGDMQTAFTDANGRVNPNFLNLGAGLIAGLTLTPGLYKWTSAVLAATSFTISGGPTDIWIFQIAQTYTLSTGVRINLSGGALAKNIVWVVSGAVNLGTGAHHEGVILGKTGITAHTGSTVNGRLLAQTMVALQIATVVSL